MKNMKDMITIFLILIAFCLSTIVSAEKIDKETGLVMDKDFEVVKQNCTVCHSAKLITQSKMDKVSWRETIRWMQEKQGLWEFDPKTEETILGYLAKHYAPTRSFRRAPLNVKWD